MQALWIWGPAAAVMAAIFVASSLSSLPRVPGDPSGYAQHFLAYALLGGLSLRGFARARWTGVTVRAALSGWLMAAAYGATDEFHQRFVPGRFAGADDWVADALGAALAVWLIWRLRARRFSAVSRDV